MSRETIIFQQSQQIIISH